jgi:ABC-2 type transport system ATP-binding protein
VDGGSGLLAAVVRDFDAAGVEVDELGLHRPTLDDVFLTLTGHAAESEAGQPADDKEIA